MGAAVEAVDGGVDVLINNAGYSQSGALETLPMDAVRRQFETNVFGALRMAQLVLPGMRAKGAGTIVNVSSMGGRLTFPGGGAYHATKYAIEAMSDALRIPQPDGRDDRVGHRRAADDHEATHPDRGGKAPAVSPFFIPVRADQPLLGACLDPLRLQGAEPLGGDGLRDRRARASATPRG